MSNIRNKYLLINSDDNILYDSDFMRIAINHNTVKFVNTFTGYTINNIILSEI